LAIWGKGEEKKKEEKGKRAECLFSGASVAPIATIKGRKIKKHGRERDA